MSRPSEAVECTHENEHIEDDGICLECIVCLGEWLEDRQYMKITVFTLILLLVPLTCGDDSGTAPLGCLYIAQDGSKYIDVCK